MTDTSANATPAEVSAAAPAPAAAPAAAQRPSWLPSKFETPEAFAASYSALETKLSGGTSTPPAPAAEPVQSNAEGDRNALEASLKGQNVAIGEFYSEYAEHGELSAASYAKLEKAGKSRDEVDSYIAGQEALIDQQTTQLYAEIGGEQKFRAVQAWAKATLGKAELDGFNAITEKGSFASIRLAVQGLNARYVAANGREPTLVGGEGAGRNGGFSSRQEVTAAMSDPRYKKDPTYRDGVIAKLRAGSPFR